MTSPPSNAGARSFVTLSGVSPDFRPRPVEPDWASLGLAPGRRYVLTVGQYAPYKNHEGALEGFAQAFSDRPDLDLVFVQRQGAGQDLLAERAHQLGLAERVRFLRALDRDTLVALYSHAAALVHPSFHEGFGNPLAEAMACGCPVVTSRLSAMPEVTGGAALVVDPADAGAIGEALRRIVDDPSVAAEMRERALARALSLRWEDFAAANLAIYRRVLSPA